MSKNISIKVGGVSRNFSNVPKIQTEEAVTGDNINWIPEDEANDYAITESARITQNGTYHPSSGKCGFNEVVVNVSGGGGGTLVEKTITENGDYYAIDDEADGYSKVTVNVGGGCGTPISFADYLNLTLEQRIATPYLIGDNKFGIRVDNSPLKTAWWDFVNGIGQNMSVSPLTDKNQFSALFDSAMQGGFELTIESRQYIERNDEYLANFGFNDLDGQAYSCDAFFIKGNVASIWCKGYQRWASESLAQYFAAHKTFEWAVSFVYNPYECYAVAKIYINTILIGTWNETNFTNFEAFDWFIDIFKNVSSSFPFFINGALNAGTDEHRYIYSKPRFVAITNMELDANHLILRHSPIQLAAFIWRVDGYMEFANSGIEYNQWGFIVQGSNDNAVRYIKVNGEDAHSGNVEQYGDYSYDHLLYPANSDIRTVSINSGDGGSYYTALIEATSATQFTDADFFKVELTASGSITLPKAYQRVMLVLVLTATAPFTSNEISLNNVALPNMTDAEATWAHYNFDFYREYDNLPSGTTFSVSMQTPVYGGSLMVVGCNV